LKETMTDSNLSDEAKRVIKLCEKGKNVLLHGPGGTGKCLSGDTLICMYHGGVKAARDIVPFDVVRGDDGFARYVTNINEGLDAMYRVTYTHPDGSELYLDCNSVHIPTLYNPFPNLKLDIPLNSHPKFVDSI